MTKQDEFFTLSDILINTKRIILYLLRRWIILVAAAALGIALGLFLYSTQKPKYVANCTFILEEKQSGLGGLSGLASQFGLDIGGMGGGGMFSGDNILEILTSQSIVRNVLLSKIDSSKNNKTLADLYLDFGGYKRRWSSNQRLSNLSFENTRNIAELSVDQDSVLNIIFKDVLKKNLSTERTSKKGTIIRTSVQSQNPEFSKLLVERLVGGAKDFYITVKTSIVNSNVARLQKKADSLLVLLTAKSYQVAQAQINDPNPALRMLQVPTELASRDRTVLLTLYSEVVKNLEMARTTLMLQTPVMEILDIPSLSLYDNRRGKLFFVAIGMLSFVVLASVILLVRFVNSKAPIK